MSDAFYSFGTSVAWWMLWTGLMLQGCGPERTELGIGVIRDANTHEEFSLELIDEAYKLTVDDVGFWADPGDLLVEIRLRRAVCGSFAGCYRSPQQQIQVAALHNIPKENLVRCASQSALAHEYGHHLLWHRDNDPDGDHSGPEWGLLNRINRRLALRDGCGFEPVTREALNAAHGDVQ